MSMSATTTDRAWNGPICFRCGAHYLGQHRCSPEDILRAIADLQRLLDGTPPVRDRTAGCPCRPENGGSGICGCVLSGPSITC